LPQHSTLFAALDTVKGTFLMQCRKRHRHQEYLDFLREIDKNVPLRGRASHLDNYTPPKHARVKRQLAERPRFQVPHLHLLAESGRTWFNRVSASHPPGTFRSVRELVEKLASAHPFV
jgi:putative transposase